MSRRARRPVPSVQPVVAASGAAVVSVAAASVAGADLGQLGAVAAQLAALVESIDRLAGRLGADPLPAVITRPVPPPVRVGPVPAPAAAAPTAPTPPSAASSEPAADHQDLSPLFYAPAASAVPGEAVDPFDWPSPAQLDEFVARRNGQQSDPQ